MIDLSSDIRPRVLFVSHRPARCGVYEFGRAVSDVLRDSRRYRFERVECDGATEFHAAVKAARPAAIVYNHHPSTMPWLDRPTVRRHRGPHLGIVHEVTQEVADAADDRVFDFQIAADPTLLLRNPLVFKTGRLVPRYDHRRPAPEVPTIGSFGFGTGRKGFETLVRTVQQQFDRARIRLSIPYATFADADGASARAIAQRCRALVEKPGIEIEIAHEFLEGPQLLDFLAQSSLNAFFYEPQGGRGISSVIDNALAVRRPIAITRSSMFRHIRDTQPPITIEEANLPDILARGFGPLERYLDDWSGENLVWDYERILDAALAAHVAPSEGHVAAVARRVWHSRAADRAQVAIGRLAGALSGAVPILPRLGTRLEALPGVGALRAAVRAHPALAKAARSMRAGVARAAPTGRPSSGGSDWVPQHVAAPAVHRGGGGVQPYRPVPDPVRLNRILDLDAVQLYAPAIQYMRENVPDLIARKIERANVQQAFVLDTVLRLVGGLERPSLLCVGSFEDTAAAAVTLSGHVIDEVDPVINYDLATFVTKPSVRRGSYDAVFSTSVIEHVADDESFLSLFEELLRPGGVGVLTCDFNDRYKPGDPLPVEDRRFYTRRDLEQRFVSLLSRSELVGTPDWRCEQPDFSYGGCQYTFASFVFRRVR